MIGISNVSSTGKGTRAAPFLCQPCGGIIGETVNYHSMEKAAGSRAWAHADGEACLDAMDAITDNTDTRCGICESSPSTLFDSSGNGKAGFQLYGDCFFEQRACILNKFQDFAIKKKKEFDDSRDAPHTPKAKRSKN